MAIGLVVYFAYGRSHSRLGRGEYDKHTPVAAGPTDSRLLTARAVPQPPS